MKQQLFQNSPTKLKNSFHNLELHTVTLLIMIAVINNIDKPSEKKKKAGTKKNVRLLAEFYHDSKAVKPAHC
jgi:hypothetical protein